MYRHLLLILSGLGFVTGCSGQLAPVKPPRIDTASAAEGALSLWDTDQDGAVSKAEAAACSGILAIWARYDSDGDDRITREEFVNRFTKWTAGDTGMMNLRAEVSWKGKPLPDAEVVLTPYELLGSQVLPARGTTDRYGFTFLAIPKDLLPASQQGTHGMQVGLYRVSITHPAVKIPARYNEASELSVDLSPGEADTGIRFQLK